MGSIDLDSHVIENDDTWSYLDPKERHYTPRTVIFPNASTPGLSKIWLMGDTWARRMPEDGDLRGISNVWEPGILDGTDLAAREETLDLLGIDAQLVHSTFWIGAELDDPLEEAALARSFNRWMADRFSENPRFPWTLRPPLRNLDRAFEEMEFGKEHGAAGIFMRGMEHGYWLCHPYYYPLWERAQDLDLAVVVHNGIPTPRSPAQIGMLVQFPAQLLTHWGTLMSTLYSVIDTSYSDIDLSTRFPRLRWGLIEGGSSWVVGLLDILAREESTNGTRPIHDVQRMPPGELAERNIYLSVGTGEDLPYLVSVIGEDVLCGQTDYGHNDGTSHLGQHTWILEESGLEPRVARKIVDDNGRRLAGVDANLRPAPRDRAERGVPIPHIWGAKGGEALVFTPDEHSEERARGIAARAWALADA
jgi:hypothetical protein